MTLPKKIIIISLLVALAAVNTYEIIRNIAPRGNVLYIHNWEDYIDEDVIEGFKAWYQAEHDGAEIEVVYSTFDTNETLHTRITKSRRKADLICPSEYMIERMYNEIDKKDGKRWLLPFNYDLIPNYYIWDEDGEILTDEDGYPVKAVDDFGITLSGDSAEDSKYYVPYMWGTLGILYNTEEVGTDEDMDTWAALWRTDKYPYRIYMKNSIRDTICASNIYARSKDLMELMDTTGGIYTPKPGYSELLCEVMNLTNADTFDADLKTTENKLKEQKKYLKGYEVDYGKDELVSGMADMCLAWSGDAVWAILQNSDLAYVVPREGSNIWSDNWVMPKTAQNIEAAHAFINYILDPRRAFDCMRWIGYTSGVLEAQNMYRTALLSEITNVPCVYEDQDEDGNTITVEKTIFDLVYDFLEVEPGDPDAEAFLDKFNNSEEFQAMMLDTLFPSDNIRARCAVMRDFYKNKIDVLNMWTRVMIA